MPRARENISLKSVDYDIAGNAIRAYYDNSHKLIFVLDNTINADKPNVLLVIDSFDDRKWDDVLANDYNVDLETVRPKRDNKYQKLDIEYGGLDVYSELINAYESNEDLSDAVANLTRFRAMSVRRAAKERLAAAEDTINKSRETIERTNESISDLRSRVKELRSRVSEQRREIGREPTKVSAAKILKTEAQIDATNEKLSRAKKRLTNAQRRLAAAEDDAEIARAILARDLPKVSTEKARPVARKSTTLVAPVVVKDEEQDDEKTFSEPKAEDMADEEVKPLFDKDPENLDDAMAFKPIDFNAPALPAEQQKQVAEPTDDSIAPAPLAFTPPAQETTKPADAYEAPTATTPMIDNLTSVPAVDEHVVQDEKPGEAPAPETFVPEEPVEPITPVVNVRPVSPVTDNTSPAESKSQKPTLMYYLLLILLILLSIGTLWLYQKATSGNIPDLAKPVIETTDKSSEAVVKDGAENPFITMQNITKETIAEKRVAAVEPEPVAAPVVEPEPVIVEAEPVAVQPEPAAVEPEPVAVEQEPVEIVVESPFVTLEPMPTYEPEPAKVPSEEEVIANKPGYNVSQNEKMFVASEDYDTEMVYSDDSDAPVSECEGGVAPNSLGCCPGENYTYTEDGFMCCNAVECFPPAE